VEEEQLNQLPQERKRLYYELQHEHLQLLGDEDKLRAKYDQLCREVGSYEEKIRGDHLKQDLIELQDKRLKVKVSIRLVVCTPPREQQCTFVASGVSIKKTG
jgi:hypothetical protein